MEIELYIPVIIHTAEQDPDDMETTHVLRRHITLPAPVIPKTLTLKHCPTMDGKPTSSDETHLAIDVDTTDMTSWDENTGVFTVVCEKIVWHDRSTQEAIESQSKFGWQLTKR